jgi:hypothetical protein
MKDVCFGNSIETTKMHGSFIAKTAQAATRHTAAFPAVQRLIASGDIHGDIKQMTKAMRAALFSPLSVESQGKASIRDR